VRSTSSWCSRPKTAAWVSTAASWPRWIGRSAAPPRLRRS
jgi:hypothetical protein